MAKVEFKRDVEGNLIAVEDGKEYKIEEYGSDNEIQEEESKGKDMINEEKIKKLLKMYGASDEEIKNFMEDLKKPDEETPRDAFDDDYELEFEEE